MDIFIWLHYPLGKNPQLFGARSRTAFPVFVTVKITGHMMVISSIFVHQAAVMILKNGGMVATVWAESIPYWASASNIVVLSLDKGEQVWLMLLNRASFLHGYMYTTFSGFIVFDNKWKSLTNRRGQCKILSEGQLFQYLISKDRHLWVGLCIQTAVG